MLILFYIMAIFICIGIVYCVFNYEYIFGGYWFAIGFFTALGIIEVIYKHFDIAIAELLPCFTALVSILILNLKSKSEVGM